MSDEQTGVLGRQVEIPTDPEGFQLDVIARDLSYGSQSAAVCRFTAPEFTSLCPKTGQPDFATIVIDYMPYMHLIESKSLKLFLFSFRNHGAFHEDCVKVIGQRLYQCTAPKWLRVVGLFNPRGGIPIDVAWSMGHIDKEAFSVNVLPIDYNLFRGRS